MRHSIRRGLLGAAAAATAIALAACSSPAPDPNDGGDFEPLTSIKLQLQWLPQAQFAGLLRRARSGLLRGGGLRQRRDHPLGRRHRAAGRARRGRRRLRDRVGPEGARHPRGHRGRADRHRAGVPEVGHAAGLVEGRRHHVRRPTSRASASARGASATSGRSSRRWRHEGLDATTVSITTQDFSMNALLDRDVDAAQAMTYNEWAQILEVVNPDTGELYQPEDFDVVSYEDTEGAMLQDAIWADTARLDVRPGLRRRRGALPEGHHQGLDLRAGQPRGGGGHHLQRRHQRGGRLPGRPGAPALDDERGQQAHLGRRRLRSRRPGSLGPDGRGCARGDQPGRPQPDHRGAGDSAYSNEYIEQALAELEEEGITVDGEYSPIDVVLTEGGQ